MKKKEDPPPVETEQQVLGGSRLMNFLGEQTMARLS